ncbi:RnfABCDGE type electron transport complex subunit D [Porphyromonas sp. COT-290 OH3588]|uniref:RnfABCDGE type electron transport complex subunit D n=1 Tax=Porphyromonas sp. COT-290 OH3588 TaxID=1515617 RepID=UPI00052BD57F|nr:RnfABCDGE type electron transport complex subunit D [Porphyromonas sp. COT-290 OH3588]KGN97137.1 Na+-transporting NADH:ubiquinone oxidoreductase subunit D [Porphyromonas sp. COT-290 OH3588]
MEKLIISPSPHIHSGDTVERNMYAVLLALIPACLVSIAQFGLGALVVLSVAVGVCVLAEWLIVKYIMKSEVTITDGSAALTGILLGMNLPSNLPVWIIAIGALVAIGVGKMSFGGLGGNIFNPALVGRVFLLIAYPAQMTIWPEAGQLTSYTDATTGATPLGIMKGVINSALGASWDQLPSSIDMLLGVHGGSLGEVSALALLLGLAYLLYKRVITWHIPVSILVSAFTLGGLMYLTNPDIYPAPWFHLLTGGMLLGAVFMATDYVTSPMSKRGQLIYGCLIGILTVAIRLFGAYPEGMSFAILIMNAFTPLINMYVKPKHFGGK